MKNRILAFNSKYRTEINGLRALAVISVIIYHFNSEILQSGFLGVDIFFVISGYVITSSLYHKNENSFKDFILGFYLRRIKRLLPALLVFILITSFLSCIFVPNPIPHLNIGLRALFGISNITFLTSGWDYFADSVNLNPFTHTWSLGVEEQFYFVFPLLIWFTGFCRKQKNNLKNINLLLIVLSLISLISFFTFYKSSSTWVYFFMPTRFWEMALGSITFLQSKNKNLPINLVNRIPSTGIFTVLCLTLFAPLSFGSQATFLNVISTSLLLLCLRKDSFIYKLLDHKIPVFIGLISYSLYLYHWSVISLSRWTIGIYWWTIPFQIILILILTLISYYFVEKPFRNKIIISSKFKQLFLGLLSLIFSSLLLKLLSLNSGILYSGTKKNKNLIDNNWRNEITSVNSKINGAKCHGDLTYKKQTLETLFNDCIIENNLSNALGKTVAFIGDSHVETLMNAHSVFYDKGYNILHYSFAGCSFPKTKYGTNTIECNQFLDRAQNEIFSRLKNNDILIISNYLLYFLSDTRKISDSGNIFHDEKGKLIFNTATKRKTYLNNLNQFLDLASQRNIKVVFIGASMRYPNYKFSIKEWFRPFINPNILKNERRNAQELNIYFENNMLKTKNIYFLDPIKELNDCCDDIKEYKLYFRDDDHFSDYGAMKLMNKIKNKLKL